MFPFGNVALVSPLRSHLEQEDDTMRLVVISDTHGLHNRIDDLPDGDVMVHAGDFMNSGYDVEDILSFNRWLGDPPRHSVLSLAIGVAIFLHSSPAPLPP